MKPTLLVLAAGIGSRYGGLKQIDPVGPSGQIIIDYSIYDAIRAGFGKVVFVIRKDIEQTFRECIGSRFESKIRTEYVFQELDALPKGFKVPEGRQKPWGTGHAVLVAKSAVKEPFAVINADDFYGRCGYELLVQELSKAKNSSPEEYFMVGFELKNTLSEFGHVARGVCKTDPTGHLVEVIERTKIEKTVDGAKFTDENGAVTKFIGNEIASMNMWGFTPSLFGYLDEQFSEFLKGNIGNLKSEFFIPTVVSRLIDTKKAKVKVLPSKDQWFGVTYKEDKPVVVEKIRKLFSSGIYPEKL
ncbi:MAG TPA: nucleotidyltransferase [Lentisphaeria bacterium]|nr:MAG: nucleotidyltransferase [Lentisphaerae bacterium GWF2_49_21]HBC87931.1 nucleotidyltransferase [Lentisphaeria bacterium]